MKITLVNPPPRNEYEKHWARFPVLGLAYVASALRAKGHDVSVLDGKLAGLTSEAIIQRIRMQAPDLVGITCMTVEFPQAKHIAEQVRRSGSMPIVLGGAHVNAVGARVLEECAAVDFACIGEGEHLVCELAHALARAQSVAEVPGLAYRVSGEVRTTAPREYHNDYDSLPFPAWDLFNVGEQIPLLTHRGCPFECNFCGHNSGFKPRYRSSENVLAEIEHVIARFAPSVIRIEDETFGLNLPRTKQILEGILSRGFAGKVRFSAQTRVDRLDAEFVALLKTCGFETLEVGVESGDEGVLKRMGKGIDLRQVERAVQLAKGAQLNVWCKFILGHPYETREALRNTCNFIARLNPDRLSVSIMTPFPGTPIYDMAVRGEGGYRLLSSDWENFDKYGTGALELQDVSLGTLKAYQVACYLMLYLQNRRLLDLARLVLGHQSLVLETLRSLGRSVLAGHRNRVIAPRKVVAAPATLSNVAMPDPTLIRLRQRAATAESDQVLVPTSGRQLRTWSAPGSA